MAKPQKIVGLEPNRSYRVSARIILPQMVEEVYAYERFIQDPTRREELHNMRISIKRLRYMMELCAVNYDEEQTGDGTSERAYYAEQRVDGTSERAYYAGQRVDGTSERAYYAEFLTTIVDLQEILGDIHDADVAVEVLTVYQKKHETTVLPGVARLIARTRETRQADYATFLEKWKQLSKIGFKQRLLALFKR